MPNEVLDPRFQVAIRKAFNLRGNFGLQALEDVTPTYELVAAMQPEWAFVRGETLLFHYTFQAGVAGNYSAGILWNPADSGLLAVVEGVSAYVAAAAQPLYAQPVRSLDARFTTAGNTWARDTRASDQSALQPLAGKAGATLIAAGPALKVVNPWTVAATIDFHGTEGMVLKPGTGLVVEQAVANTTLQVYWRTRVRGIGDET